MTIITVIKDGKTATIDEDLTIKSSNEALRQDIEEEVEFAQYGGVASLPVLLILYNNLKLNIDYEIAIDKEILADLRGVDDVETNF